MANMRPARKKIGEAFGLVPGKRRARKSAGKLEAVAPSDETPMFSPFKTEDKLRSSELAAEFSRLADTAEDDADALDKVSQLAIDLQETENPALVQNALGIFLTHHPTAMQTPVPSLLKRTAFALAATSDAPVSSLQSGSTGAEAALDWYREDPLANEHHEHWHWVYEDASSPLALKERHGELFYYMHQQMLARYDTERRALGMTITDALGDYTASIGEGYDPGQLSIFAAEQPSFSARPAGAKMKADPFITPPYTPANHADIKDRLVADIKVGKLEKPGGSVALKNEQGSDILGLTHEPTIGSVNSARYGNHHGMGHVLIGAASPGKGGVMYHPAAAIRDPAFWRWHRHVDDMHFAYQDGQQPHDFSDRPKNLKLTGANAAVMREFGPLSVDNDRHVQEAAEGLISKNNPGQHDATKVLETWLRDGAYTLLSGARYGFLYLHPEPFIAAYGFSNTAELPVNVTIRLFLLPDDLFDIEADPTTTSGRQMRRFAIELDKVAHQVPVGASTFGRSATSFSVIRRPAVTDPAEVADVDGAPAGADVRACTCGWPYGLVLPRGTPEAGMNFHLFAMLTDNTLDRVGSQKTCGSMSFCGVGDKYPDRRPMGYPFDRRLNRPLIETVTDHDNMLLTPVKIKWANPPIA